LGRARFRRWSCQPMSPDRRRRSPRHAQRAHAQALALVVHAGLAGAGGGVDAHAQPPFRPEAAGDVGRDLALAVAGPAGGQAGQVLVGRALGQQVDDAAYAAAGRRGAGQEGRGAAQHFHALEQLGGDVLARQQVVQAVVGDVVRAQDEAADEVRLLEVAEAARHAHARVVLQHVGDAAGLAVLDELVGVAGDAERRIHVVARAQDTGTAASRDLPAGVGGRQALCGGVGAGLDLHAFEHGHGLVRVARRLLGLGDGRAAGQGHRHICEGRKFHVWSTPGDSVSLGIAGEAGRPAPARRGADPAPAAGR